MMEANLASNADAQLILKLYELRTEETMRAARKWLVSEFWPETAEDVSSILSSMQHPKNGYLRQVTSYWEMAAAFVLYGALNAELFLDCNRENLFIYAKLQPFLTAVRESRPGFLEKTEQLLSKYPAALQSVKQMSLRMAKQKPEN